MILPASFASAKKIIILFKTLIINWFGKHYISFYVEVLALSVIGLSLSFSVEATIDNTIVAPRVVSTTPSDGYLAQDIASPVEIEFSHPFARNDIKFKIDPPTKGKVNFVKKSLGENFVRKIVFQPSITLKSSTLYTVQIENIHSIAGFDQPKNYSFKFKTIATPKVASSIPTAQTQNFPVKESIYLKLNYPNNYAANFSFIISPPTPIEAALNENHTVYIIKPKSPLKHSTSYELLVEKAEISYDLEKNQVVAESNKVVEQRLVFTTLAEPKVAYVSANGDNALPEPISITFDKDMNKQSVEENLRTTNLTDYTIIWNDNKTLVIKPKEKLAYNTTYTITFLAGTLALDGSYLENDYLHTFTTIGNVKVGRFSPTNGATGVKINSKIYVYFNQAVDKDSAKNHFSITPIVDGSFSWDGNTMVFSPTASLDYLQSYTVTITAGVKSLAALDSVSNFSTTFKTADLYEVIKLSVPVYKQKYSLSCEFANMSMVLAFKGVGRTEDQLIAETPFDNTPNSGDTWGDPYAGFVGNVNGTYFVDGYGAYYPVVTNLISKYRPAEAHVGWNIESLLKEVRSGNPVIIWSCLICNGPRYWNTPSGKQIYAYEYYHMLTVVGYTGKPSNPETITVNDSTYGRSLTLSKNQFLSKWATMNNTAVVVK